MPIDSVGYCYSTFRFCGKSSPRRAAEDLLYIRSLVLETAYDIQKFWHNVMSISDGTEH